MNQLIHSYKTTTQDLYIHLHHLRRIIAKNVHNLYGDFISSFYIN